MYTRDPSKMHFLKIRYKASLRDALMMHFLKIRCKASTGMLYYKEKQI